MTVSCRKKSSKTKSTDPAAKQKESAADLSLTKTADLDCKSDSASKVGRSVESAASEEPQEPRSKKKRAAPQSPQKKRLDKTTRATVDQSPEERFRSEVGSIIAYRSYKGQLRFHVIWRHYEICGPIWEDAELLIDNYRRSVLHYLHQLRGQHMNVFNRLLRRWPILARLLVEEKRQLEQQTALQFSALPIGQNFVRFAQLPIDLTSGHQGV